MLGRLYWEKMGSWFTLRRQEEIMLNTKQACMHACAGRPPPLTVTRCILRGKQATHSGMQGREGAERRTH